MVRSSGAGHDYALEPVVGASEPSMRLLRTPICRIHHIRQVRTRTDVENTVSKRLTGATVFGALGLMVGGIAYASAPKYPGGTTDPDELRREDIEAAGLLLVGTGAVSALWAVGMGIAARDTVEYGDWRTEKRSAGLKPCGDSEPVAQQVVRLEAGQHVVNGLTDDEGIATFSLPIELGDLPPTAAAAAMVSHRKVEEVHALDLTRFDAYDDAVRRARARAEAQRKAREERQRKLEEQRAAARAAEQRRLELEARRKHEQAVQRLVDLGAREVDAELRISPVDVAYRLELEGEEALETLPADSPVWVVAEGTDALGFVSGDEDGPSDYEDLLDVEGWTSAPLMSPREYRRHLRKTRLSANLANSVELDFPAMKSVLELDVLRAFDLTTTYDTPLKRKRFRKSEEYSRLREQLAELRRLVRTEGSHIRLSGVEIPEYSLQRKRFSLVIGSNRQTMPAECFRGFCFRKLPIRKDKIAYRGKRTGLVRYTWLISASEGEALAMENQTVDIYFLFEPVATKKRRVRYRDYSRARTTTEEVITTRNVRVLITLEDDDAIIWQRNL